MLNREDMAQIGMLRYIGKRKKTGSLADLTDVSLSGLEENNILIYDGMWRNVSIDDYIAGKVAAAEGDVPDYIGGAADEGKLRIDEVYLTWDLNEDDDNKYITIGHAETSFESSDNDNHWVIQNLTADAAGHAQNVESIDLHESFYTKDDLQTDGWASVHWNNITDVSIDWTDIENRPTIPESGHVHDQLLNKTSLVKHRTLRILGDDSYSYDNTSNMKGPFVAVGESDYQYSSGQYPSGCSCFDFVSKTSDSSAAVIRLINARGDGNDVEQLVNNRYVGEIAFCGYNSSTPGYFSSFNPVVGASISVVATGSWEGSSNPCCMYTVINGETVSKMHDEYAQFYKPIIVGDSDAAAAGMIRYRSGVWQGHNGTGWLNFGGAGYGGDMLTSVYCLQGTPNAVDWAMGIYHSTAIPANYYYGTNSSGSFGFYAIPAGGSSGGDMYVSSYADQGYDHYVDQARRVSDGSNVATAAQIRSHIDNASLHTTHSHGNIGVLNALSTASTRLSYNGSAIAFLSDITTGGGEVPAHNNLTGLQGGASGQYYHLTSVQLSNLTGNSHAHANLAVLNGIVASMSSAYYFGGDGQYHELPTQTTPHSHSNYALLEALTNTGNGALFLANDGNYKSTPAAPADYDSLYYRKTQMQTSGQAQLHWGNLTNAPTFSGDIHTNFSLLEYLKSNGDALEYLGGDGQYHLMPTGGGVPDDIYLPLTGGTLTGNLTINFPNSITAWSGNFTSASVASTPTSNLQVANKLYVDNHSNSNITLNSATKIHGFQWIQEATGTSLRLTHLGTPYYFQDVVRNDSQYALKIHPHNEYLTEGDADSRYEQLGHTHSEYQLSTWKPDWGDIQGKPILCDVADPSAITLKKTGAGTLFLNDSGTYSVAVASSVNWADVIGKPPISGNSSSVSITTNILNWWESESIRRLQIFESGGIVYFDFYGHSGLSYNNNIDVEFRAPENLMIGGNHNLYLAGDMDNGLPGGGVMIHGGTLKFFAANSSDIGSAKQTVSGVTVEAKLNSLITALQNYGLIN